MDPRNFFLRKFDHRGPLTFKMETKQQKHQEEEIPILAKAALNISRKCRPRGHQPYDLPTWGQIKTLTNQDFKNLVSQQEMPQSPENLPITMLTCSTPT